MASTNAEELLADPEFDVEKFIHNVRLHATQPILDTLFQDPYVLLSIAESKDSELLQIYSPRTPAVYLALEKMGFETWEKTSTRSNSWWYGIVVTEELAILAKSIQNETICDVYKGENAAVRARKRYKELKFHNRAEAGEPIMPGKRPVDLIRSAIMEKISCLISKKHYYGDYNSSEKSSFSYELTPRSTYEGDEYLIFKVMGSGYSLKVSVEKYKLNPDFNKQKKKAGYYYNRVRKYNAYWESEKISMKTEDGQFKTADYISTEVVDYLQLHSKNLAAAIVKKGLAANVALYNANI